MQRKNEENSGNHLFEFSSTFYDLVAVHIYLFTMHTSLKLETEMDEILSKFSLAWSKARPSKIANAKLSLRNHKTFCET